MIIRTRLILFLISVSLISLMCTSNPIFEDRDSSSKQTVKGRIQLSDGASPDNVFVWLEGLNISTYTNDGGHFTLQLPPPQSQSGGGLTGDYRIFYYVGNYRITTSSVVIRNGSFEYGAGDIDTEGNIDGTKILQKLADINTVIQPSEITEYDSSRVGITLFVTVTVVPKSNSVKVKMPIGPGGLLTAMIFKGIDASISDAVFYGNAQLSEPINVTAIRNWQTGIKARNINSTPYYTLEAGEHEVIPYIRIVQDDLPDGLIESIGENAGTFNHDYLKIPVRLNLGHLTVTE